LPIRQRGPEPSQKIGDGEATGDDSLSHTQLLHPCQPQLENGPASEHHVLVDQDFLDTARARRYLQSRWRLPILAHSHRNSRRPPGVSVR